MSVITVRHLRAHYVAMARWCNRNVITYTKRSSTPLFPAAARLNAVKAAEYRGLREEYMERARAIHALDR